MSRPIDLWNRWKEVQCPVKVRNKNWDIDYFEVIAFRLDPKHNYPHACGFAYRDGSSWGTGTILQPTDPWELVEEKTP